MVEHDLAGRAPSWSTIPTSLLRAELSRRGEESSKPACKGARQDEYNTSIHVAALFIILILSIAGCAFPLITQRAAAKNGKSNKIVFFSQHFGTGVLVATAFVHLLPVAFISLTDPCLPWFFSEGYESLAGVIAMIAVFAVTGIEMLLRTRGGAVAHSHAHADLEPEDRKDPDDGRHWEDNSGNDDSANGTAFDDYADQSTGLMDAGPWADESTPERRDHRGKVKFNGKFTEQFEGNGHDNTNSEVDLHELDPLDPSTARLNGHANMESHSHTLTAEEERSKKVLRCLLLEAGILFHSIFIGMALSVASGNAFIVFFIAICFHQTFEGTALGSRIAAIKFPRKSWKPWMMVLAYGLTTPIGQAIGLAVHTLYDPKSQSGLLMVGVMNAISAGLLLFAGLVQLLAEDFLSDISYSVLRGKARVQAFIAVLLGAFVMALVGAWA